MHFGRCEKPSCAHVSHVKILQKCKTMLRQYIEMESQFDSRPRILERQKVKEIFDTAWIYLENKYNIYHNCNIIFSFI